VHVSVQSPEEGVGILDRIRTWLPVILALSSNSPFANGDDTGYASYRTMAWRQWPCAGPTEVFGSVEAYRAFEQQLLGTGVLLDEGMLYLDARLSRNHPTVEIRVADVCLSQSAAVTVAALCRALVETAGREWADGLAPVAMGGSALRLASWQASLSGVRGALVHPLTGSPQPADAVVRVLLEHLRDALVAAGDHEVVSRGVQRIMTGGTGAEWQRSVVADTGRLADVVVRAVTETQVPETPSRSRSRAVTRFQPSAQRSFQQSPVAAV
jgi:carboxylate-amine ligase